jgi:spore germination protein D
MKVKSILLLILALFLSSCASNETGGGHVNYDETKKMVVDILKTDGGKKAIQDVISDDKMKEKFVMDQQIVSQTIEKTLTSDQGAAFWKKSFEDPKFAQSVAQSMRKENEQLLKDLMKDPEYRGMMIEVLKDPEIQKEMADGLKSKESRENLQQVIIETFDNPLFKVKMQEALTKAAEEAQKSGGKEGQK